MRITLFHNARAGAGELSEAQLLAAFGAPEIELSHCSTKSDEFEDLLLAPADLIVIAGGDGTVAKVLACLPDRTIPVAVLPLGTANNVARAFGITGSILDVPEFWRTERTRPLDIGCVRGAGVCRRFVEAVGLGPLSEAIVGKAASSHDGSDRLRGGRVAICDLVKTAPPLEAEITLDGRRLAGRHLAVEIMNIPYAGPALPLVPAADPGDGILDVACLPLERREDMMTWLGSPLGGLPPVVTLQARKVEVAWKRGTLHVDDDRLPQSGVQAVSIELEGRTAKLLEPSPPGIADGEEAA